MGVALLLVLAMGTGIPGAGFRITLPALLVRFARAPPPWFSKEEEGGRGGGGAPDDDLFLSMDCSEPFFVLVEAVLFASEGLLLSAAKLEGLL